MINKYIKIKNWYKNNVKHYAKTGGIVLPKNLNFFLSFLEPKSKIIDLGSGVGQDTDFFTKKGFNTIGVDFTPAILNYAKKNKKGKFKLMNILSLGFEDNTFDGAWISSVLTHLEKKDIFIALNEARRVLKPKGVIGIIVKWGRNDFTEKDKKGFIFNIFTKKTILKFAKKSKLFPLYNKTFKVHNKKWLLIILRNNK